MTPGERPGLGTPCAPCRSARPSVVAAYSRSLSSAPGKGAGEMPSRVRVAVHSRRSPRRRSARSRTSSGVMPDQDSIGAQGAVPRGPADGLRARSYLRERRSPGSVRPRPRGCSVSSSPEATIPPVTSGHGPSVAIDIHPPGLRGARGRVHEPLDVAMAPPSPRRGVVSSDARGSRVGYPFAVLPRANGVPRWLAARCSRRLDTTWLPWTPGQTDEAPGKLWHGRRERPGEKRR